MTKKIHVLADETLGGTLREYVEVDRKAEVGELINVFGHAHKEGNGIFEVKSIIHRFGGKVYSYGDGNYGTPYYGGEAYTTLEPTDIVHIEGSRFRLVDRQAEVGERILVKMDADADEHNLGEVYEVISLDGDLVDTSGFYDDESTLNLIQSDYYVLVPVESESSPQSTDDIIANLVRRVSDLERQTTELEKDNERQAWKIVDLERDYGGVKDDVETWAQEVEKVRRTADTAEANLDDLAERQRDHLRRLREMERTVPKKITIDVETFTHLVGGSYE